LNTADAIKQAKQVGDAGDLPKARSILEKQVEAIQNSMSGKDDLSKAMIDDLKDTLNDMQNKSEYFAKAQKKMVWKEQAHSQERAVGKGGYETSAKKEMKSKFMKPQAALPPKPQNVVSLNKKITIGNEYEKVANTAPVILPGQNSIHKWKMFVRSNDAIGDIEKVIFQLHPTFQPNKVTVASAPFEVERTGWGTFIVEVAVHYQPQLNKPPSTFQHELVFEEKGSSAEHTV